jgi:predicted phage terminase large subunit-like protein
VHSDVAARLERFSDEVARGMSPRLMLLMPPRAGKSELASRMFPAWHLGRHPDHEYIACSYNVSLAMSFSRKVQETIDDPSYQTVFPKVKLNPNFRSMEEWGIDGTRGGYVAAGVGGGINGKGAHVLGIDDPFKNAEEADSADLREKLWNWFGSTAYTRLAPGGGVLVIQTWWHDDDLAGRLQLAMAADPEADQYEVVKYPAIAEWDEYIDEETHEIVRLEAGAEPEAETRQLRFVRAKGDALHPERYDVAKLLKIKKTIPPRFWSALYQQNPVPDDGSYFLKEQFVLQATPPKERCHVFIAFDFAISEKKANDYTVGSVMLQDDNDQLHVAEIMRFKSADGLFIVDAILNLAERWRVNNLVIGLEDGQIYRAIATMLQKRMRERKYYPSIKLLKPITDKLARARSLQGRMQQRMVCFPPDAEWFGDVRQELLRFPAGVHDDIVDSLAWCAQLAVGAEPPKKPKVKEMKSWRDRINTYGVRGQISHMSA